MRKEIWATIPGDAILRTYEISNYGNVRSISPHGKIRFLHPGVCDGYYVVYVYGKMQRVHRLVAAAFLDNKDNLPCVNHKDYDRKNNYVENLEWCTQKYNCMYSSARLRGPKKARCETKTGHKHIHYSACGNYKVQIVRRGIKPYYKVYRTLEEAINGRDRKLEEIDGKITADKGNVNRSKG